MEDERFNYIILDSRYTSWNATEMTNTWTIPQYFFSEYKQDDEIYLQLESSSFSGELSANAPGRTVTIYMSGVNVYNQKSDFSTHILGLIPVEISLIGAVYNISAVNPNSNNMKLRTERFHTITLAINHANALIDPDGGVGNPFRFVLKVSYKSKKN
jgi:hypothetical protein